MRARLSGRRGLWVCGGILCGLITMPAQADTVMGGTDFVITGAASSGAYGTNATTTFSSVTYDIDLVENDLQARTSFHFSASVPYIQARHADVLLSDARVIGYTRTPTAQTTTAGWGDWDLGMSFDIATGPDTTVAPFAGVKLPTAAPGLGTGAMDEWGGINVSQNLGRSSVFGTFSYTLVGQPHTTSQAFYEPLQNVPELTLGATTYVGTGATLRVSYDDTASELAGFPADRSANIALSGHFGSDSAFAWAVGAGKGIGNGAPDTAFWAQLTIF